MHMYQARPETYIQLRRVVEIKDDDESFDYTDLAVEATTTTKTNSAYSVPSWVKVVFVLSLCQHHGTSNSVIYLET